MTLMCALLTLLISATMSMSTSVLATVVTVPVTVVQSRVSTTSQTRVGPLRSAGWSCGQVRAGW